MIEAYAGRLGDLLYEYNAKQDALNRKREEERHEFYVVRHELIQQSESSTVFQILFEHLYDELGCLFARQQGDLRALMKEYDILVQEVERRPTPDSEGNEVTDATE